VPLVHLDAIKVAVHGDGVSPVNVFLESRLVTLELPLLV